MANGEVAEKLEERRAPLGEIAEEASGQQKGLRPEDRSGEVPDKEAGIRHPGLPGDRRGDGAEAGNELREEQRDRAAARKVAFGLADAGRGLER